MSADSTINRIARRTGKGLVASALAAALALVFVAAADAAPTKPLADSSQRHARIVNGSVAAEGSWPFIVSIRESSDNGHHCGGSVIAPNLILTAAHCAVERGTLTPLSPASIYVVAKQTRLDATTGERLRVAKIVVHPQYQLGTFNADAALLFLADQTTAPPIALATTAFETSVLAGGIKEWTAGWGSTSSWTQGANGSISGVSNPNTLMEAQLNVYTADQCNTAYNAGTFWPQWDLCVGDPPTGTCNGDSGGPHVVQAADGSWVQIGVTSIGIPLRNADGTMSYCRGHSGITRAAVLADWAIAEAQAYNAGTTTNTGTQQRDTAAPALRLAAHKARARHSFKIRYTVRDNSGESAETLVIKRGGRIVVRLSTRFGPATGSTWTFRVKGLRRGTYRIELRSQDRAGNVSRVAVAKLRVR
jgi:secreted trypsin-like serine protease